MNCCLTFLFFNCIAGIFVFLVLGLFVLADNPFLIEMNTKKINDKTVYRKKDRQDAYYQYFSAAGFNVLFAFTIWYIPTMIDLLSNKKNIQTIRTKSEMQTINEGDENININNYIKESNNIEINTNTNDDNIINNVNTGKSMGMTEKISE